MPDREGRLVYASIFATPESGRESRQTQYNVSDAVHLRQFAENRMGYLIREQDAAYARQETPDKCT